MPADRPQDLAEGVDDPFVIRRSGGRHPHVPGLEPRVIEGFDEDVVIT